MDYPAACCHQAPGAEPRYKARRLRHLRNRTRVNQPRRHPASGGGGPFARRNSDHTAPGPTRSGSRAFDRYQLDLPWRPFAIPRVVARDLIRRLRQSNLASWLRRLRVRDLPLNVALSVYRQHPGHYESDHGMVLSNVVTATHGLASHGYPRLAFRAFHARPNASRAVQAQSGRSRSARS